MRESLQVEWAKKPKPVNLSLTRFNEFPESYKIQLEIDPRFQEFTPIITACLRALPETFLNSGYLKKITVGTTVANKAKEGKSAAYWDETNAKAEAIEGLEAGTITIPDKYLDITKTEKHRVKIGLTEEVDGGILTLEELIPVLMHEIGYAAYLYLQKQQPNILIKLLQVRRSLINLQNTYMEEELQGRQNMSFEKAISYLHTHPLPFVYYSPNARLIGDWQRIFASYVDASNQEVYEFVPEIFCAHFVRGPGIFDFERLMSADQRKLYLGEAGMFSLLSRVFPSPQSTSEMRKAYNALNSVRSANMPKLVNLILAEPNNLSLQERFKAEFGIDFATYRKKIEEHGKWEERSVIDQIPVKKVSVKDLITSIAAALKFVMKTQSQNFEIPEELLDDLRLEVSKPLVEKKELIAIAKTVEAQLKIDFPKLDYRALGSSDNWAERVFFVGEGFLRELWLALFSDLRIANDKLELMDRSKIFQLLKCKRGGVFIRPLNCIFIILSDTGFVQSTVAHEYVERALSRGTKESYLSNFRTSHAHGVPLDEKDEVYDLHECGIDFYLAKALHAGSRENIISLIELHEVIVWDMLIKRVGENRLKSWLLPGSDYGRRFFGEEKNKPILVEYRSAKEEFEKSAAYLNQVETRKSAKKIFTCW